MSRRTKLIIHLALIVVATSLRIAVSLMPAPAHTDPAPTTSSTVKPRCGVRPPTTLAVTGRACGCETSAVCLPPVQIVPIVLEPSVVLLETDGRLRGDAELVPLPTLGDGIVFLNA